MRWQLTRLGPVFAVNRLFEVQRFQVEVRVELHEQPPLQHPYDHLNLLSLHNTNTIQYNLIQYNLSNKSDCSRVRGTVTFVALLSVMRLWSSSCRGRENSARTSVRLFEFRSPEKSDAKSLTRSDFLRVSDSSGVNTDDIITSWHEDVSELTVTWARSARGHRHLAHRVGR